MVRGLNTDSNIPIALRSIIGPYTKNASKEPLVKDPAKERAKKESTVEQMETMPAKSIMAKIEVTEF
jgi:hypothetical protein